jgi:hypothetical protein
VDRLIAEAESIWSEGYKYYTDKDGWKVNKRGKDGAVVYSKKGTLKGKHLFKLEVS